MNEAEKNAHIVDILKGDYLDGATIFYTPENESELELMTRVKIINLLAHPHRYRRKPEPETVEYEIWRYENGDLHIFGAEKNPNTALKDHPWERLPGGPFTHTIGETDE